MDEAPPPKSLSKAGVVVELLPGTRILRLTRNPMPFGTVNQLIGVLAEFEGQIHLVDRSRYCLLIDTRLVQIRDDAGFERAFRHFRERVVAGFGKVAVLVRSEAGLAQASAHAGELGPTVRAFADERGALDWLSDVGGSFPA